MIFAENIVEAYLLAFLVWLHVSLLLCGDPQGSCFWQYQADMVPSVVLDLARYLMECVPINLGIIHKAAHLALLGDIMFLGLVLFRMVRWMLATIISGAKLFTLMLIGAYLAARNYEYLMALAFQSYQWALSLLGV